MASMKLHEGYEVRRQRRADMLATGKIMDPGMLRVAIMERHGIHCGKKSAKHSRKGLWLEGWSLARKIQRERERDAAARERAKAEFESGALT